MDTLSKSLQKSYPVRADIDEQSLDKNSSLAWMLQMIGRRKDVLDVGCASGYLAKLAASHDCNVVGIDINPEAAKVAQSYCVRVIVADLDFVTLTDAVGNTSFDVAVFGDILEHLRDPARVLSEARSLLRADGFVVASIPNIAHGATRLALLRGDFDYQDVGLLDETHLRFFTLKTIEELFLESGFDIQRIERTKLPLFEASDMAPNLLQEDFSEEVIEEIKRDPEFDTLQFIVRAVPLSDEARLRTLTKRFIKVNTQRSEAESRAERQRERIAQLTSELERRDLEVQEVRSQASVAHNEMLRAQDAYKVAAADQQAIPELRDKLVRSAQTISELATKSELARQMELELVRTQERLSFETSRLKEALGRHAALEQQAANDRKALAELTSVHEALAIALARERDVFEADISTLKDERAALERQVEDAKHEREGLIQTIERQASNHSTVVAELEKQRDGLRDQVGPLDAKVESLQIERATLERVLADLNKDCETLTEAMKQQANAHAASLEEAQKQRDDIERQHDLARQERDSFGEKIAQLDTQIRLLRRDRFALERRLTEVDRERAKLIKTIKQQTDSHAAALEETQQQRDVIDRQLGNLNRERDELIEALQHQGQQLKAREHELSVASETITGTVRLNESLSCEMSEIKTQYLAQTQAAIDLARHETQQVATLIDIVQTSKFWDLKRFFNRLRGGRP